MTTLSRPSRLADLPSTKLLMRILERPGLVAAVRELPGAVLGKLIDRIGLEDAGELVALASTAQLERVFDDDLWRAERAGGDERFRPERFVLWLRVMAEAGEAHLVQRLCELPPDLVALAVHRLVLVLDFEVLEELLRPADEEAEQLERALADAAFEEFEELRVIAREPDAWDDVWGALMALDRDHHERLRAILERCCEMSTEYISGQGGLFQVLTAEEMLDSDVAAGRDDRRSAEGFVSPADARAFLELARRGGPDEARDPITRAYFRGLETPARETAKAAPSRGAPPEPSTAAADRRDLDALLQQAEVLAPAPARALPAPGGSTEAKPHLVAPLFEQAMSDLRQREPALFDGRAREVGYLVNVWIAGGAHDGRRPRPVEALEMVLRTCEVGMRAHLGAGPAAAEEARAVLAGTPADLLFRRGFAASAKNRRRSRSG
ncbi:MAG TPA: DUF6178 family protein [Polyangia bacterium]|jgi:hypothetical protein